MSIKERLKRQFLLDGGVVLVIIILASVFVWGSSRSLPGWDIKGSDEVLVDEEKVVDSNIYIRDGGSLRMENATLSIEPRYDHDYALYIAGDSTFDMNESRLEGGDFQYFVTTETDDDGKSPTMTIRDSIITGHSGIRLFNRTKFEAIDSTVEELQLTNDVRVNLENTSVYPVLFTDKTENFNGLRVGEKIDLEIESNSGWDLTMKGCDVWGYQIEIFSDSELTIAGSDGIVLSIHSPGDLVESEEVDVSGIVGVEKGNLEIFGADVSWNETVIDMINVYATGEDEVVARGGLINELDSLDDSHLTISDARVYCNLCGAYANSTLILDSVTIVPDGEEEPTLLIQGVSAVEIRNSDIRKLRIVMLDLTTLIIENSQYEEDMIDNRGEGEFTVVE